MESCLTKSSRSDRTMHGSNVSLYKTLFTIQNKNNLNIRRQKEELREQLRKSENSLAVSKHHCANQWQQISLMTARIENLQRDNIVQRRELIEYHQSYNNNPPILSPIPAPSDVNESIVYSPRTSPSRDEEIQQDDDNEMIVLSMSPRTSHPREEESQHNDDDEYDVIVVDITSPIRGAQQDNMLEASWTPASPSQDYETMSDDDNNNTA
jgi:hypothetical protein